MPVKSSYAMTITTPTDREFVITRDFDAPRRLVFAAWTDSEHMAEWRGCAEATNRVCEMDVRPGGAWRFAMDIQGKTFALSGVFREVKPPERLVYTERFEDAALGNPEWLTTMTFEERDGVTTMRMTCLHPSVEQRDGHLHSGVEKGWEPCFARLDEHLAERRGKEGK